MGCVVGLSSYAVRAVGGTKLRKNTKLIGALQFFFTLVGLSLTQSINLNLYIASYTALTNSLGLQDRDSTLSMLS